MMNSLTKLTLPAVLLSASLTFTTSCSNNSEHHEDSKEQAEDMNEKKFDNQGEKDADRLSDLAAMNMYEIKASEDAANRATTDDVKKLAAMMVTAHTKMGTELQALAASKNISLPTDMTDDHRKNLDDLLQKTGLDFDEKYTSEMKDKHEDAIKKMENVADKSEDADIKAFGSKGVTELRTHLDMVEAAHNKVKDMKDADKDHRKGNTIKGADNVHDGKDDIHKDDHKNH